MPDPDTTLDSILNLNTEIIPFFGQDAISCDRALITLLQTWTENQARQFVGHCISETVIENEYHRHDYIGTRFDGELAGLEGRRSSLSVGMHLPLPQGATDGNILQLRNGFVRSVEECCEDLSAHFGQQDSDFGDDTILTYGEQYYLEMDMDGLSKSGRLIRNVSDWSYRPGTIRVSYTAGLTTDELSGEYSFVKLALLEDMQVKFNAVIGQRSGRGPISQESWAGDYSVKYTVDSASRGQYGLSQAAREKLQPIKRINL